MRDRKIIKDPGAFQLLADETRMRMIYLLRAQEMTVSQIARELGLTPQTIYHHIKKLRDADMVEVSREERVEHLVESFYRATAGYFHFVNGGCGKELEKGEVVKSALTILNRLGYEVEESEKQAAKIFDLSEALRHDREDPDIVGRIFEMDDIDPSIGEGTVELAMMMKMTDKDFEEYIEKQKALREALRARGKGRPKT